MNSLSPPDIESELSYAYLHAVASRAGMGCKPGSRHDDNRGIDATVTAWLAPSDPAALTEVTFNVQLKATVAVPVDDGTCLSYFIKEVSRYNALRVETIAVPRILVVLFLPSTEADWLAHSVDDLILRRCAHWVSLRGAPDALTSSGKTVKLPKAQVLSPEAIGGLAERLSRRDYPRYPAA